MQCAGELLSYNHSYGKEDALCALLERFLKAPKLSNAVLVGERLITRAESEKNHLGRLLGMRASQDLLELSIERAVTLP
jgi:hypothetical protein